MKVLIIILIILIIFIIFKSHYETFDSNNYYDEILNLLTTHGLDLDNDEIIRKLKEYNSLRTQIEDNKIADFNTNFDKLKKRYTNTKLQLENILFNKFRPNRLNFNEKQQDFKLKLNSFIDELNGTQLKMTNYGSFDTKTCEGSPHWKLPDNVPPINNKGDDMYYTEATKCCIGPKESCIINYKKNIKLYNDYKLVLKNKDNNNLELNKIEDNIYIVNLNSQIIKYTGKNEYNTTPFSYNKDIINNNKSVCFKVIKITDLIHLNQFITDKYIEDDLLEYPLYLINSLSSNKVFITIHNEEGQQLSIQHLTKEMINNQIFYKN